MPSQHKNMLLYGMSAFDLCDRGTNKVSDGNSQPLDCHSESSKETGNIGDLIMVTLAFDVVAIKIVLCLSLVLYGEF